MPQPLISPEYAALNRQLHIDRPDYGTKGAGPMMTNIVGMIRQNAMKTVLDYGCGKGAFKVAMAVAAPEVTVLEYDPAIPGKETLPDHKVDLAVALDVMEHIEPAYLDSVLTALRGAASGVFLVIALTPAGKTLADGRNAHLIVRGAGWWRKKLERHFRTLMAQEVPGYLIYAGLPARP